jgi:hypothetical protein
VTCNGTLSADCNDIQASYAECDCGQDTYKDVHDYCSQCPDGQIKPVGTTRTPADIGPPATALWPGFSFDLCTVRPPADNNEDALWVLLYIFVAIFAALILAVATYGAYKVRKNWKMMAEADGRLKSMKKERIHKAFEATKTCRFNVCFIKYNDFKRNGKLEQHEVHRERGELISLDTYEEVFEWVSKHYTMFVSHQWLGFTEPDPDNIHFPAICSACESICSNFNFDESELYVWVDYVSIPQRNPYLKQASISSLAVYASVVRYFVIIAPRCVHKDKQETCDSASYQRRGWCRLEQWARMTVGGLHDMYIHEDGKLQKIEDKPTWYGQSIRVFDGDFTVDSDRDCLVDTVMGLWYVALLNEKHADNRELKDLVEKDKERVFPKSYFFDYIETLEAQVNEQIVKDKQADGCHHAQLIRAYTSSRNLGQIDDVPDNVSI